MLHLGRLFARSVQLSTHSASKVRKFCGSLSTVQLPPNLQLADEKVLEEPPLNDFPSINYSFATLDVPENIEVKKLLSPGETMTVVPLERRIFEVAIRKDIVHNVIRYVRHKKRQPKKTKRIHEISGSKKKPRPQKGSGQAQVGNKRNSVWRGGQKAFGPVLRDYSIKLNRKVRALGMMMTLAAKFREGNLIIFDSLACTSPKTKELHELLELHGIKDCSVLFVDEGVDEMFSMASRNLSYALTKERRHINVYEILKKDKLVIGMATFAELQEQLMAQYLHSGKRKAMMETIKILEEDGE